MAIKSLSMTSPLTEPDRDQILADLTEAQKGISNLVSDLRRRYSAKSQFRTPATFR